jgi:tetraacyldisaccharide-1-P 4'-kinase
VIHLVLRDILVENKFNVAREIVFPDHYDYSLNDLEKIRNIAKNEKLRNYNYRKRLYENS